MFTGTHRRSSLAMDEPSMSGTHQMKRQAILTATPPEPIEKKIKSKSLEICTVCEKSSISKSNPLQQQSQETWNNLAHKALEWKGLDTVYNRLHEHIQVDTAPIKVHQICKLDVVGVKLERAQESFRLSLSSKEKEVAENPVQHSIQPRARSSRLGFSVESSCVICF